MWVTSFKRQDKVRTTTVNHTSIVPKPFFFFADVHSVGGWDPKTDDFSKIAFPSDLREEIAQAFANVDIALKDAGGKGWSQVQ